jgi:hypothetical protein
VGSRQVLLARSRARFDSRFLLCAGLLAAAACAPPVRTEAAPSSTRSGAELYRAGLHFLASADLLRAEQYFAGAMAHGYDERACVRGLLLTTVRGSRFRSALRYAGPALEKHPRDLALRQLVASIHYALGELGQAERELERVLAQEERPEANFLLWRVRAQAGAPTRQRCTALERYLALAPAGPHAEEAQAALAELAQVEARASAREHRAPACVRAPERRR